MDYYQSPGGRPTDFERLVLVHHRDDLVHCAGCQLLEIDGRTLVWVHIAVTDPAHQGRGLLLRASRLLLDPQWIASLPRRVVFRTPNPIVYEAVRAEGERFADQFPGRFSVHCYPEIDPAGGRLPGPPEIERLRANWQLEYDD